MKTIIARAPRAVATAVAVAAAAFASPALAYPDKPVTIVVPFAPGGSSDSATRMLAEQLSQKWKKPVVVENKPGAYSSIGAGQVARAAPDGYTILLASVSVGTIKLFLKNPGFDPLKDLTPVTQIARGDYVLAVNKSLPVSNMKELAEYARANPDKVNHAAFGSGSMLAFEQFSESMKFKAQNVNYRGEAMALNALMAGDVQLMLATLSAARPFIEAGRIKPVGIFSKQRSPIAPDIPSADESGGSGYYVDFWFGFMVPTGTPEAIRRKIAADTAEILQKDEVKKKLYSLGLVATSSTAEAFGKLIHTESTRWVETAKRAGLQAE
ncbi:MAG: tripartite tricarboxylate transporter substrate binding protein [Pigmentiphaga sp.]|uniref:Bug family tripartite tricarboxylate transporter substrate binding protein n=1 Tax=Pigmentiphaga sp. TaxID=1977564 RepID=UPI0029B5CBA4|nr:tripartite tricarboxylate transporter substrate binding protein [Pigmentiphaga sp.]MDX3906351.1 tripartite tricarboxylate transporter substrate binding protein [Pigmentiphaga sp.]